MNRELNKIFDVKTREARRRILDKFDISNEDKNEVLNKIEEGGSNSDGGDSSIEYLDVSGMDKMTKSALLELSFYVKVIVSGNNTIALGTMTDVRSSVDNIIALGVDINANIVSPNISTTLIEYIQLMGILDMYNSVPRITKEEFYNLENPE